MPRIAAAIAVVVTVTLSIGLNIAQYPSVWDMVASSEHSSQSAEPAQAATADQSSDLADSAPAAQSDTFDYSPPDAELIVDRDAVPIKHYSADVDTDRSRGTYRDASYSPEDPAGNPNDDWPPADTAEPERGMSASPYRDTSEWPAEISPSMKYGASVAVSDRDEGWESAKRQEQYASRRLVPVTQWGERRDLADASGRSMTASPPTPAAPAALSRGVRRLPPVDPSAPIHTDESPRLPDAPIPIYPDAGA
jgi:hypothetical protein